MRRTIKAYLVNRSNRPVNRSNRPVYRSKPVTHAILNLDLNSNRSAGIPVQTDYTCDFEFWFEFNRFPPIFGQIGPVNRYWRAAVWPDRSGLLTLPGSSSSDVEIMMTLSPTCGPCRLSPRSPLTIDFTYLGPIHPILCIDENSENSEYQ